MSAIPPRVPVSQGMLDKVLRVLRNKKSHPDVFGFEKSQNPAEIIFKTTEGDVLCQVKEDDLFVYLELPSGISPCFIKQDVLSMA